MSLYQRFCQLDRNAKGFISADEFLSIPEFLMNPLFQVDHLVDFKIAKLSLVCSIWVVFGVEHQMFENFLLWLCGFLQRLLQMVDGLNFKDFVAFLFTFSAKASMPQKVERR